MKLMRRIISIILIFVLLLPIIVFAENTEWICPNCKRKNTTSFCPDCGTKRPEIIQNDNDTQFAFQNGIEFGDSKEIVQEKDNGAKSDSSNKSILISKGDYLGIHNFEIKYFFSEAEGLTDILYVLYDNQMKIRGSQIREQIKSQLLKLYGTALPEEAWETYSGFPWVAYDFADKKIGKKGGLMGDSRWAIESSNGTVLIDIITYWPNVKDNGYKNETICLGFKAINTDLDNTIAIYTSPPKPKNTPTPTPRPTPTINPEIYKIAISSLRIGKNSIGDPELYVIFKNNSTYTIDRIDFNVICYDAYGSKIKGYNYYDSTDCYFDDRNIKPGGKTPSDHHWTLYGFDGTKAVDIVITSYHTTNGITVRVPESLWNYTHYQ